MNNPGFLGSIFFFVFGSAGADKSFPPCGGAANRKEESVPDYKMIHRTGQEL
jgi:hypothetical protein